MIKAYLHLLFLSLFFVACSGDRATTMQGGGEEAPVPGIWHAMEISKTEVRFSQSGGSDTITVKNYEKWWINSGCNGECAAGQYISTGTAETGETDFNHIDGGWWSAEVLKNSPNKVVITTKAAEECTSESCVKEVPRKASIGMTAGDVFAQIKIYQE